MARNLEEILGGVQNSTSSANSVKAAASKEARLQLDKLKVDIISGEDSTGDPLQDGIISLYGEHLLEDPLILERYQKVAAHLREASLLDPVVVINRWVNKVDKNVPGHRWLTPYANQGISVGLLKGHELVFEYGASAALPTSIHVNRSEYLNLASQGEVETGNIVVDSPMDGFWKGYRLGYDLDNPRLLDTGDPFGIFGGETFIPLEVLAGRERIARWLADTNFSLGGEKIAEFKVMRELSQKLGQKPIEAATDGQSKALEKTS